MDEAAIRTAAASYMFDRLSKRGVTCLLTPMVWHGNGSLSRDLKRFVSLNPIRSFDPKFDSELDYMDIEPDIVAICKIGSHALTIVGECKSKGNLAVSNLAQVLLYSTVSKATAGAMFFTGSPTRPVKKILDDEVLVYRGYDRHRILKEKMIGFYQYERAGSFEKLWPQTYDVLDLSS